MSTKVKERLSLLGIDTIHEERVDIDKEIEAYTGRYCDAAVGSLSDSEFRAIVERVKQRPRKKLVAELAA